MRRKPSFIRKVLVLINVVFIVGLFLGFLAAYVSPDRAWILAFAGLFYPLFALLNLLFLLFWIIVRKPHFVLPLIALAVTYPRTTGFVKFIGNETKESGKQLKVMSYNVRLFDHYQWKNNRYSQQAGNMVDLIKKENPAVLCLQEYYHGDGKKVNMEDSIFLHSNIKYKNIVHLVTKNKKSPYGVATYSRFPIIDSKPIFFKGNSLNISSSTDIKVGEDTLRVLNIHMESIRLSQEDYVFVSDLAKTEIDRNNFLENSVKVVRKFKNAYIKRARQARLIREEIKKSPHRVIVCGDFNDTPSSYAYYQIASLLNDSFVVSGKGLSQTYAGKFPSFRIDYILVDPKLSCSGYRRIKKDFSDHYPVVTTVEISD